MRAGTIGKSAGVAFCLSSIAFCLPGSAIAQAALDCPAIDSRAWTARVEADPFSTELRLVVFGQMLMPTPGYQLSLTPTLNAKSYPPIQFFDVGLTPPAEVAAQALAWHDVVYEGPADAPSYRMVKVRCGAREIASVQNVAQAVDARRF